MLSILVCFSLFKIEEPTTSATLTFALRSDFRVYGTLLDDDRELFCYDTECDDDQYLEAELLVGLEYKF